METPQGAKGVIGLRPAAGRAWAEDLEALLRTMARTISLAVERALLSEKNTANALAQESERLSKLLLDSVSHELRTPLTVIQGAASVLGDEDTGRDEATRRALLGEVLDATDRLNGIVENLLSMGRLESGNLRLQRVEVDPEDLLSAALKTTDAELKGRKIEVEAPATVYPLSCDAALVVQVLINLLRNSARYAGDNARIAIEIGSRPDGASFSVRDDGPGVREADLGRLFDKFFRAERTVPGGTGLGLAICKGIVAAHGGRIAARNLPEGGFAVDFELPALPSDGGS
jgi:two-component system sensor histidine kinase KdpD